MSNYQAVWVSRDGETKTYTYPCRGTSYRGYKIYKRHSKEYHIVKDGYIDGMFAGPNGARQQVDMIADGEVLSLQAVRAKLDAQER